MAIGLGRALSVGVVGPCYQEPGATTTKRMTQCVESDEAVEGVARHVQVRTCKVEIAREWLREDTRQHTVLTSRHHSDWVISDVSGQLCPHVARLGGFTQARRPDTAVWKGHHGGFAVVQRLRPAWQAVCAESRVGRGHAGRRCRGAFCGPTGSPYDYAARAPVGSARRQPSKGAHRWMSGQRQQASSGQASGPVKSADGKRRWRGCAGCWPARMRNGGRGGGRGSGGRRLQRAAAPGCGVGDWAGQPCSQQAGVSYTDINSMASRLLCADESDALAKAPSQLARLCEAQRSGAAAATGGSGEWMAMEGGPARLDWQRW